MSDRPNPTPPHDAPRPLEGYGQPPIDPLAAAKRAGALQLVIGCLGSAGGLCIGAVPFLFQFERAMSQVNVPVPIPPGWTAAEYVALLYRVMGGLLFIGAATLAGLAFGVRRSSRVATIGSLVVAGIALLLFLVQCPSAISMFLQNPAVAVFTMVVLSIPIGLLGTLVAFLSRALKAHAGVHRAIEDQKVKWTTWQQAEHPPAVAGGWSYAAQIPQSPQQQLTPPPVPPAMPPATPPEQ